MDINHLLPRSDDDKFLRIPYKERWEHLKPIIVELYLGRHGPNGEPMTPKQLRVFMRDHYSFHAAESEYRTWLNKTWGVRRRALATEKEDIAAALGKRTRPGTSTSNVTLHGNKDVDKKQLKRYLNDQIRHRQAEPMWPGVLTSWNLPYAAYSKALGQSPDQPSPFGGAGATPSYLTVASPDATTPGHQAPGPSPTLQLVHQKVAQDRASFLLQGRHLQLLASCGKEDRITLTNYLHDFYTHSFVIAKHWGRGPRPGQWTAGLVSSLTLGSFDISSPGNLIAATPPTTDPDSLDAPTDFCRWSIHVPRMYYTGISEPVVDAQDGFDIQDPRSWPEWSPAERRDCSFTESLQESVTNATFSRTPADELPIATESISRSVQHHPEALRVDAWKVAIMAGNVDLLEDLAGRGEPPEGIDEIHPFHLAATFLNGGKTCCDMITALCGIFPIDYLFHHNHDEFGHTVLDTFMVAILRSHTSIAPKHVSMRFNPPHRFPGEEQDICGRWDPVSPCVRALFRRGHARVPTGWKHALCHTATQAICHNLIAILGPPTSPRIDAFSGLFVRRCSNCGLELKIGPLHTLVVVAFYLAHRGMPGETLFGALAILVCLLSLGADASLTAVMSVNDILGHADAGRCHHKDMDASDLIEAVPPDLVAHWSMDCQTGWACILQVLLLAKRNRDGDSQRSGGSDHESQSDESDGGSAYESDDDQSDGGSAYESSDDESGGNSSSVCHLEKEECAHTDWLKLPCGNPKLGLLWATIQVELLTYRRIDTGDSWVSHLFSTHALKTWLEGGSAEFLTPLVEREMMRDHSACGWFYSSSDFPHPVVQEVCTEYFMNMDVHDRATYLDRRYFLSEMWREVIPADKVPGSW